MARNPWPWRARSSASKPVASAQAPWTNTIVGVSAAIVVTAPLLTVCPMPRLYPGGHAQPRQAKFVAVGCYRNDGSAWPRSLRSAQRNLGSVIGMMAGPGRSPDVPDPGHRLLRWSFLWTLLICERGCSSTEASWSWLFFAGGWGVADRAGVKGERPERRVDDDLDAGRSE